MEGAPKNVFCNTKNECLKEEITIPVPFGVIKGVWWGPKHQQPVLALHGWQDNAGTWDALVPFLVPEVSVLAIDLPGHGLSSHIPKGQMYYLAWDGILLVRRIANYFKWKKVTILGHSLGGAIGFLYAGIFPNDIEKLVSIDVVSTSIKEPSVVVTRAAECVDRILAYEKLSESSMPCYEYEEMINLVEEAYRGSVNRESCKILMKRGMSPSSKGNGYHFSRDVRLKAAELGLPSWEVTLEVAGKIRCNVLNIRGKPGLTFEKPHLYQILLNTIRRNAHVEFHEINGTHHLHLNNPERISDIVKKFLIQPIVSNGLCSSQYEEDEDYPI